MTKSVEEIVETWESKEEIPSNPDWTYIRTRDLRALIASWRKRGEALQDFIVAPEAYPRDIFPEPDLAGAHEALKSAGMTLDGISAHIARRVLEIIGKRARTATEDHTDDL